MSTGGPRVGVIGCTGYAGSECARWLLTHPHVELAAVVARNRAGMQLGKAVPALDGLTALTIEELDYERLAQLDAVLLAMPHGVAKDLAPSLAAAGVPRILDLSADHRYTDGWTYGLVDWNADAIGTSTRVAVPGCFATAIELCLAPFAAARAIRGPIAVQATTGSTGAGVAPSAGTHHPERFANLRAYKVLTHQHVAEIRSTVELLSGEASPPLRFVPHSGPFDRGILATCFIPVDAGTNAAALVRAAYEGAPLVRIRDESPEVRHVRGTAFADLAVHQDGDCAVVMCSIDNLGKGAASQAVQCLNLLFGWPHETGLKVPGCTP